MKKYLLNYKTIKFLLLFTILIPFIGCREDEEEMTYYDTYIDGYITDYNTGTPVQGVIFDAYYFTTEESGWFGPDPYKAQNIAVSDSRGYYRIKVPKYAEWNDGTVRKSADFVGIRLFPRDLDDYTFEDGQFMYAEYSLRTKNKRINITPISYGYLKVTLPKNDTLDWGFSGYNQSVFELPFYKPKLVSKGDYSDSLKYLFFRVVVGPSAFRLGFNHFDFTINSPRDTVYLNVE